MKKIAILVGARPNFMKAAPIIRALRASKSKGKVKAESSKGKEKNPASDQLHLVLIHSGQHYDRAMSQVFFTELGLPKPDRHLGVGSGSQAEQTAGVMAALEPVLREIKPALLMVVGDVNSTMAGALTAVKLHIPVAHVEAGLRSFNREMPEEINRVVTDSVSDLLFTTEKSAEKNLRAEGVPPGRIHFVGNVMIDTLLALRGKARKISYYRKLGLQPGEYALVTLHRPSNVDAVPELREILRALVEVSKILPVVFPVHPRTRKNLEAFGLWKKSAKGPGLILTEPLGYLQFLSLMDRARMVLTDSGGIQEETTVLGVPCLTMRNETERPVTVEVGTNIVVGSNQKTVSSTQYAVGSWSERIVAEAGKILRGGGKKGRIPAKWDGKAAIRIVEITRKYLLSSNAQAQMTK